MNSELFKTEFDDSILYVNHYCVTCFSVKKLIILCKLMELLLLLFKEILLVANILDEENKSFHYVFGYKNVSK